MATIHPPHRPQAWSSLPPSSNDTATEIEYDRLRALARQEQERRAQAGAQAREAYNRGDGSGAHAYSETKQQHARLMAQYNQQASDFIFREHNADGRAGPDTIDLHGQYVNEAENLLTQRIRAAQAQGQTHLRVVVGKGNHSALQTPKLKPAVEKRCRELGLRCTTDANNAGRIEVDLMPTAPPHDQLRPPNQEEDIGQVVRRFLPRVLRKLQSFCVVM
ncbi:MAG: hypothetical protein M1826_006657 [Phylliscum demangeonii]|nr:MAG: hypothetical protein M1826_006657 [Phylliscum demangeonii]